MDFLYEPAVTHASLCSIFVDDDFLDCKLWSPPSPKRCDRGTIQHETAHGSCRELRLHAGGTVCGYGNAPHSSLDEFFLYCTEELGSESTSGAGYDVLIAPATSATNHSHGATSTCSNGISNTSATLSCCSIQEAVNPSFGKNYPLQSCSSHEHAAASEHLLNHQHCHHRHHSRSGQCAAMANTRTFPPPLSSLLCDRPLMRSFKANGRFLLKKVANASRSLFRSTRKDGRLRLDLLSSPSAAGLDDQCFPTPAYSPPQYLLDPPIPSLKLSFAMLSHKPSALSYGNLPPQALAMLMDSNSTCPPAVEKPKTPSSASTHVTKCPRTASLLPPRMPRVFALLSFFPVSLHFIIFEFGQAKLGAYVILHRVYIMKSLRFQGSSLGMGAHEVPRGELFPIG